VIVGTGTAAMVAAIRSRAAGWTVAIIDFRPTGGTCALRGCDPKKMLIASAETVDSVGRMRGRGVAGDVKIDWPELIAFKRTFTDPISQQREHDYAERGIDTFHGHARVTDRNTMGVDGTALEGRHFLIAAGAEPIKLGIPGAEHLVTHEDFLAVESLPLRIVLVGGGYIAAEFAHIAARAGAPQRNTRRVMPVHPQQPSALPARRAAAPKPELSASGSCLGIAQLAERLPTDDAGFTPLFTGMLGASVRRPRARPLISSAFSAAQKKLQLQTTGRRLRCARERSACLSRVEAIFTQRRLTLCASIDVGLWRWPSCFCPCWSWATPMENRGTGGTSPI